MCLCVCVCVCDGGGGVTVQHGNSVESRAQPVELRLYGSKFNVVQIQSYTINVILPFNQSYSIYGRHKRTSGLYLVKATNCSNDDV